jgi:hypothetical protein
MECAIFCSQKTPSYQHILKNNINWLLDYGITILTTDVPILKTMLLNTETAVINVSLLNLTTTKLVAKLYSHPTLLRDLGND